MGIGSFAGGMAKGYTASQDAKSKREKRGTQDAAPITEAVPEDPWAAKAVTDGTQPAMADGGMVGGLGRWYGKKPC